MYRLYTFTILLSLMVIVSGCRKHDYIAEMNYDNDNDEYDPSQVDIATYPDWTEETHSIAGDTNYDVVFAQDEVLRIDITMSSSSWKSMWSDLSSNLSSSGMFGGMVGVGNNVDLDFTPVWVPCTITYDDTDWYQVGIRFKGNSSLSTAYTSGNEKLSMKLSFDEYEDNYPALTNQRFFGFKQLNLNNNYNDASLMREKIGSDLFREFGLASANTSFVAIYIDYGSGPEYFGVYTIVEEVDDTVIKNQFSDGSGNLYKPEDDAAYFKSGTYDESEFYLKTNTSSPDYSDVRSLYNALHDGSRTSNNESWQTLLESTFDVDNFIKWLAANTAFQNWDTYGNMAHNYFLYNDPDNGLLTWIPWDNNEAFQSGDGALSPSEVTSMTSSTWPLISYIIAVDRYKEAFDNYLQEFIDEVFIPSEMIERYEKYYTLLYDYAAAEESGRSYVNGSFTSAVSTLKTHVSTRNTVVTNYLK